MKKICFHFFINYSLPYCLLKMQRLKLMLTEQSATLTQRFMACLWSRFILMEEEWACLIQLTSTRFMEIYMTLLRPWQMKMVFSKDYIDAMKELKVTNMRWPGGNFLMGYDWKDGIGPKDQRPVRINLAWGGIDNNHVGTDEWMKLNKAIGSENIVGC